MRYIGMLAVMFLQGCSLYGASAGDPVERGLAYVASALVVSALIGLLK